MGNMKEYIKVVNAQLDEILKLDKTSADSINIYRQYISNYSSLDFTNNNLDVFERIKEIPEFEFNVEKEIRILKKEIQSLSKEKKGLSFKIRNPEKKLRNQLRKKLGIREAILLINETIEKINLESKNKKNEIYEANKENLESIERFIVRRLFVEYVEEFAKENKDDDTELIKAFIYNIEKKIEKIKSDEDNWMLGKNIIREIKKYILKKEDNINLSNSKCLISSIIEFDNDYILKKFVLKMYSSESLRNKINSDNEILKIQEEIDLLVLDFIDVCNEGDLEIILRVLDSISIYNNIIDKLGYKEIELNKSDRLDTELCTTIEVESTDDIEKDFIISKIYRNGYKSQNKVLRRAMVKVYRFSVE